MNDNHPKPWKVKKESNNIVVVDNNGIPILRMAHHDILVKLNKKKLALARQIVRLINANSG